MAVKHTNTLFSDKIIIIIVIIMIIILIIIIIIIIMMMTTMMMMMMMIMIIIIKIKWVFLALQPRETASLSRHNHHGQYSFHSSQHG